MSRKNGLLHHEGRRLGASRKHRRLTVERLEERQLLSSVGFSWETPLGYDDAGVMSGNIVPGTLSLIPAPDLTLPATINPYHPPQEVEAWIDGSTVRYRANVGGVWQEGSTSYDSDQVIVDVLSEDGVVAWTVGTALPNGQIVARKVGVAIYDTNQGAWKTAESPNLGVLAVTQLDTKDGIVAWTIGYPTTNGYVPREVGAAVYDSDPASGGWKFFQTNTSGGTRTIEELLLNDGSVGWAIGDPTAGSPTPVRSVGMATYDFVNHEWARFQVNARASERFINVTNGGGAMFWAITRDGSANAGAPQNFGVAVYDEARHQWKSNRTSYDGSYVLGDFAVGDGVAAWTLTQDGVKVGIGMGAWDSRAGGVVFRRIPLASHQEVDRLVVGGQIVAWVARDRANANNQQIFLATYDAGQSLWKTWSGSAGNNQQIGDLQVDGWAAWTVRRQDNSGQWVDRSAVVAVYDPGRGVWKTFQSPEATNRSVINLGLSQSIAAWKIGYADSSGGNYVPRNVGAVSYDYLTGQFNYYLTSYDTGTFIEYTAVGDGVAAWSTGSNVTVLVYDPVAQSFKTASTAHGNNVRIRNLTTQGRLVAWTVAYPSGYDDSFIPRDVEFAAYDTQIQSWVLGGESYPTAQVTDLYIEHQFVKYAVNGTGYSRAYDAWTSSWGTGNPVAVSTFLAAPTVVPVNRGITVLDWSMGATDGFIDFGDGWKSDSRLTTHAYRDTGVYTLSQQVFGPGGSDTSLAVIAVVPARTPTDLGTISSTTLPAQSPINGALWYSFQVAADGAFTANVTGAGVSSNTAMALCTSTGQLYSLVGTGTTSLAIPSVTAGTTYYLMISGLEGPVNVALDNPPTLSLDDRVVTVRGTLGDDEAYLSYFGAPAALINGVFMSFEPGTTGVIFDGGAGRDTVGIYGTDGDEHAVLGLFEDNSPGADVMGLGFQLSARNSEDITFVGGGGQDVAELSDTPGADLFTAEPGLAVMTGSGLRFAAENVPIVHGYSRRGGNDEARLTGTAEKDQGVVTPQWTWLRSIDNSYFARAKGFRQVTINGGDGADSVEFRDSAGKDVLAVSPGIARISYPSVSVIANGFEQVQGNFSGNSQDEAYLFGTSGNDTLTAEPFKATLQAGELQAVISGASQIVVASMGGQDSATLLDSTGDDTLLARPRDVTLTGTGYLLRVLGYKNVAAHAARGGTDVAHLYDSTADDLFVGQPGEAVLQGPGYSNTVRAFDYVHAYSITGGRDVAQLYGSSGDDEFVSWPEWTRLSGPGYFIRVKMFEEVTVDGGGGNDTAVVNDSPGPDALVATGTEFRLSGNGASIAYLHKLLGFEQIRARSHGGANTKSVDPAALAYLLLSGKW